MSGLILRQKHSIAERLNVAGLTPSKLALLSAYDISHLKVGSSKTDLRLGDVFDVTGSASETLTIVGTGTALDFAGAGLDAGTLRIEGPAGAYAGHTMSGGRLEITGDAGNYLAAGQIGGLIVVEGSAGDNVGGVLSGQRFGMMGGTVVVGANIGARAGDKMRRGTIIARGKTGTNAGTRMLGGTIWAEGGFGLDPGFMMRRGTLIGPSVERMLPTFADCGRHDLLILRILARYFKEALGPMAPKPLGAFARRVAGDMATIGKGEILLPAS